MTKDITQDMRRVVAKFLGPPMAAMARLAETIRRQAVRMRCGLMLVCVLAAGIPGCGIDPRDMTGVADPVSLLVTAPLWIPVIAVEVDQAVRDTQGPPRKLHAIKARVTDLMGRPVEATLTARVADRYTASPERLPSRTYQTGGDGEFVVVIGQRRAVCVEVTAAGMQPARKWFMVLYEGVARTWPEDQSEIIPLNGSYEMNGHTDIRLAPAEL